MKAKSSLNIQPFNLRQEIAVAKAQAHSSLLMQELHQIKQMSAHPQQMTPDLNFKQQRQQPKATFKMGKGPLLSPSQQSKSNGGSRLSNRKRDTGDINSQQEENEEEEEPLFQECSEMEQAQDFIRKFRQLSPHAYMKESLQQHLRVLHDEEDRRKVLQAKREAEEKVGEIVAKARKRGEKEKGLLVKKFLFEQEKMNRARSAGGIIRKKPALQFSQSHRLLPPGTSQSIRPNFQPSLPNVTSTSSINVPSSLELEHLYQLSHIGKEPPVMSPQEKQTSLRKFHRASYQHFNILIRLQSPQDLWQGRKKRNRMKVSMVEVVGNPFKDSKVSFEGGDQRWVQNQPFLQRVKAKYITRSMKGVEAGKMVLRTDDSSNYLLDQASSNYASRKAL